MRSRSLVPFVLAAMAACGSDGGTPPSVTPPLGPSKDTIFTVGLHFSPNFITVPVGAVVWFSLGFDGVGHDVRFTEKAGAPNYIPVSVRTNVAVSFPVAGDFPFICPTHPEMTGSIKVQ